jgi:hypothetical protein
MEGVQDVTIAANTIRCNQPTEATYDAIFGRSIPPRVNDPDTPADETRPPVPIDNLVVSQNRARGRCKTLVRVAPVGSTVPVGAVTVAENQTNGFNIGVRFEGSIPPSVKPRISENLFVGTAPANFVQGPPGFTFDGSNGPQP